MYSNSIIYINKEAEPRARQGQERGKTERKMKKYCEYLPKYSIGHLLI